MGTAANKLDQDLRENKQDWLSPYDGKKITGAGKLFSTGLDISASDVSRCRNFASLYSWGQVEERMNAGWTWSYFKLMIDHRSQLGDLIYSIPPCDKYRTFKLWVDTQLAIVRSYRAENN